LPLDGDARARAAARDFVPVQIDMQVGTSDLEADPVRRHVNIGLEDQRASHDNRAENGSLVRIRAAREGQKECCKDNYPEAALGARRSFAAVLIRASLRFLSPHRKENEASPAGLQTSWPPTRASRRVRAAP
jgi:hypothetical protein